VFGCLFGAVVIPTVLLAQDTLLLRYQPRVGTVIHTVAWTDMTVTIGQRRVDQFGPESLTIELSELESLTEVVRGPRNEGYVVEVTFDSVRARMRPDGGTWEAVTDTSARPVTGLVAVDSLRRAGAFSLVDASTVRLPNARRLRSLARRLALALPEQPVTRHAQWTTDVVFPVNTPEAITTVIPTPALDLRGFATVAVDSIVTVPMDTLAYLRFDGVLAPPEASDGLEAALRVTELDAIFAGTYVWSTGWNAYVSGATRLQLNVTLLQGTNTGVMEGMEVGFDALYRFQVRP
jgi:hypothetical protein